MTTKAAFSPDEWASELEGPPIAGMIVITAAHGGMFRETLALSKAYIEARDLHRQSETLDEIVAAKPKADHTKYHSPEELRDNGLQHLRDAVALLESKATAEEVDGLPALHPGSREQGRSRAPGAWSRRERLRGRRSREDYGRAGQQGFLNRAAPRSPLPLRLVLSVVCLGGSWRGTGRCSCPIRLPIREMQR